MPVSTFATIVGLMSNFMSERRAVSDDEYKEFLLWLESKRHKTLIEEINANHLLSLGIKNLLKQNQETIISKLEDLNKTILLMSSKIDGFNEIAHAIEPNLEISDQAISIVKQLEESGGSVFLEIKALGGTSYQVMDGSGVIEINDERFIDDDLNQLVNLNLLRGDYNSQGGRLFHITRAAVNLLKQMNSKV